MSGNGAVKLRRFKMDNEKKLTLIIKILLLIVVSLVIPGALPGIIIGYLLWVIIKLLKKNKNGDLTS